MPTREFSRTYLYNVPDLDDATHEILARAMNGLTDAEEDHCSRVIADRAALIRAARDKAIANGEFNWAAGTHRQGGVVV